MVAYISYTPSPQLQKQILLLRRMPRVYRIRIAHSTSIATTVARCLCLFPFLSFYSAERAQQLDCDNRLWYPRHYYASWHICCVVSRFQLFTLMMDLPVPYLYKMWRCGSCGRKSFEAISGKKGRNESSRGITTFTLYLVKVLPYLQNCAELSQIANTLLSCVVLSICVPLQVPTGYLFLPHLREHMLWSRVIQRWWYLANYLCVGKCRLSTGHRIRHALWYPSRYLQYHSRAVLGKCLMNPVKARIQSVSKG